MGTQMILDVPDRRERFDGRRYRRSVSPDLDRSQHRNITAAIGVTPQTCRSRRERPEDSSEPGQIGHVATVWLIVPRLIQGCGDSPSVSAL